MRIPHYLVRRKNGNFQFRKRIPAHLWPCFEGRRDFRHTLRTSCMATAQARALVLSMRYDSLFDSIGMQQMPNINNFKHLTQGEGKVGTYTVQTSDGSVISVNPNNPADHTMAMEYVREKHAHEIAMENVRLEQAKAQAQAAAADLAVARAGAAQVMAAMKSGPVPAQRMKATEASESYDSALPVITRSKTRKSKVKSAEDFLTFAKVEYVDEINRTHVSGWIRQLRAEGNQDRTIKNKLGWVKLFIDWTQEAGYFPQGDNPASAHKSVSGKRGGGLVAGDSLGTSPFTADELSKVLTPENLSTLPLDMVWSLLIEAYTGARITEIAQLYLNDIMVEDGVLSIRIDVVNPEQHLKTESSRRKIPLHPTLIEFGFCERIKALEKRGQQRIFPNANLAAENGAGDKFIKHFGRYLKKVGIKEAGRRLGYHSIRKTFIQTLANTDFNSNRREYFVGHEVPTVDHKEYVQKYSPRVLLDDLVKFWHPPIDLARVKAVVAGKGTLERIKQDS